MFTVNWPWTLSLQLQTFCFGEMRSNHLHTFLHWFCCFTGFSFLEELLSHLQPTFYYWSQLCFLDMASYRQTCKQKILWCKIFLFSLLYPTISHFSTLVETYYLHFKFLWLYTSGTLCCFCWFVQEFLSFRLH